MHFVIGLGRRMTIRKVYDKGIWLFFEDRLPIVIYTVYYFMSPAKLE